MAVKFAFCKALEKERLSPEEIAKVKKQLGIPGDALDALKAGNIKPLTAAEVREVIDKYAGGINRNRATAANGAKAAKTLKTSNEFYRGVGKKEMDDRAATRNAINATSIGKMKTGTDKAVNNMLDILQAGKGIAPAGRNLAREIMTILGNPAVFTGRDGRTKSVDMHTAPIRFSLHDDGTVVARFRLDNGNFFSVNTGLDRAGLVDKAVNVMNGTAALARLNAEKPRVKKDVSDDEIMKSIGELETGDAETESDGAVMSNEKLLNGISDVFQALKKAKGPDARRALREANMEDVVKVLLQALGRVRGLDNRNTELVRNVREVFYGNKNVDSDDLLREIAEALNEKRVDPKKKVDENIMNQIEDDLDENFNINAFLSGN